MSLLAPVVADRDAALSRRNPVAKFAALGVLAVGLLSGLDPVTPTVLLAFELLAFPLTGLAVAALLRRLWPLLLAIAGVAVANVVGAAGGRVLAELGPVDVTTGGLQSAGVVSLRLLALSLPSIVVLATTDPMDAADALVQRWRVPPRFAYGVLAALRLLPLLAADWQTIARARRARGLDGGRNPVLRLRAFAGQTFAVLVAAVRRGVRLAAAMDARGFDAARHRSVARPQPMQRADWALVAGTVVAVAAAITTSAYLGMWRPPIG